MIIYLRVIKGLLHQTSHDESSWLACVVDGVVRLPEVCELLFGRADQHVVHEEGVVGSAGNHPDPQLSGETMEG